MAAVVLAAGAGSRFDASGGSQHKLLAPWKGRPLVWWSASCAVESSIGPTWVVCGSADLAGALPPGVTILRNDRWEQGHATSLRRAVDEARAASLDAIVVGLGDQPLITPGAWRSVASAEAAIAVATYEGVRRNPVKLASDVWDLLPTTGDEGARGVIARRPDLVHEVPCEGQPADIDTREDLDRWS